MANESECGITGLSIALELAEKWREGYDVVYAVREARDGESRIKRQTAKWFYRLMGRLGEVDIPADAGDFRLVDRRAVDSVLAMPEHHLARGLRTACLQEAHENE